MTTRILTTDAQGVRDLRRLVTGAHRVQGARTGNQPTATRTRPIVVELIADIPADGQPYPVVQITDAGDRVSRNVRNISTRVVTADDNGSPRRVIADAIGSHGLCVESVASSGTTSTAGGCCGDPGGGDLTLDDDTITAFNWAFGIAHLSISTGSGEARIDLFTPGTGAFLYPLLAEWDQASETWICDVEEFLTEYNSAGENVTVANDPQGSFTLDRSNGGKVTLTLEIQSITVAVWSIDDRYWLPRMSLSLVLETSDNTTTNQNCTVCVTPVSAPTECSGACWPGRPYPLLRVNVGDVSVDWTDAGEAEYGTGSPRWSTHVTPLTEPDAYLNILGPVRPVQPDPEVCLARTIKQQTETHYDLQTGLEVYKEMQVSISGCKTVSVVWQLSCMLAHLTPPVWFTARRTWGALLTETPVPGDVISLPTTTTNCSRGYPPSSTILPLDIDDYITGLADAATVEVISF